VIIREIRCLSVLEHREQRKEYIISIKVTLKMFSKLARSVVRHAVPRRNMAASFDGYGQHLFKGAVAVPYLEKAGLPANTLDTPAWTSNGNADKV
jgi:hypothetical protein